MPHFVFPVLLLLLLLLSRRSLLLLLPNVKLPGIMQYLMVQVLLLPLKHQSAEGNAKMHDAEYRQAVMQPTTASRTLPEQKTCGHLDRRNAQATGC